MFNPQYTYLALFTSSPPASRSPCKTSPQLRGSVFGCRAVHSAMSSCAVLMGANLTLIAVQLVGSLWIKKLSPKHGLTV